MARLDKDVKGLLERMRKVYNNTSKKHAGFCTRGCFMRAVFKENWFTRQKTSHPLLVGGGKKK